MTNNRMFYAKPAISRSQCARGYTEAEPTDKYSTLSFLPAEVRQEESTRFHDLDRSLHERKTKGARNAKKLLEKKDYHLQSTTDEFYNVAYRAN